MYRYSEKCVRVVHAHNLLSVKHADDTVLPWVSAQGGVSAVLRNVSLELRNVSLELRNFTFCAVRVRLTLVPQLRLTVGLAGVSQPQMLVEAISCRFASVVRRFAKTRFPLAPLSDPWCTLGLPLRL